MQANEPIVLAAYQKDIAARFKEAAGNKGGANANGALDLVYLLQVISLR